jgi:hypothetical protein
MDFGFTRTSLCAIASGIKIRINSVGADLGTFRMGVAIVIRSGSKESFDARLTASYNFQLSFQREAVRNQRAFTAALCAALVAPAVAIGKEQVDVCAEYTATGKIYHVTVISTNGSELNEETNTLNYNSLSQYILIFWTQDRASVIEMNGPYFGPAAYAPSDGTDQEGRSWRIWTYSPVACGLQ